MKLCEIYDTRQSIEWEYDFNEGNQVKRGDFELNGDVFRILIEIIIVGGEQGANLAFQFYDTTKQKFITTMPPTFNKSAIKILGIVKNALLDQIKSQEFNNKSFFLFAASDNVEQRMRIYGPLIKAFAQSFGDVYENINQ